VRPIEHLPLAFLVGLGLATSASVAHAERVSVGGAVQLLPKGALAYEAGGVFFSNDTATAFGFAGVVDYAIDPSFSVGLVPRYLVNVRGDHADEAATQLDLAARATGRAEATPQVAIFAFAAPGYSFLMPPRGDQMSSGFILGFGGGAEYRATTSLWISAELGYTIGFQSREVQAVDLDFRSDFIHLGLGIRAEI